MCLKALLISWKGREDKNPSLRNQHQPHEQYLSTQESNHLAVLPSSYLLNGENKTIPEDC